MSQWLWSHYRVKSRFSNLNRGWSKSLCDRTNYPFEDPASKYDKQNKLESFKKLNFRVHDLEKYSCGLFSESKRLLTSKSRSQSCGQ